jgi:hypothetical protein
MAGGGGGGGGWGPGSSSSSGQQQRTAAAAAAAAAASSARIAAVRARLLSAQPRGPVRRGWCWVDGRGPGALQRRCDGPSTTAQMTSALPTWSNVNTVSRAEFCSEFWMRISVRSIACWRCRCAGCARCGGGGAAALRQGAPGGSRWASVFYVACGQPFWLGFAWGAVCSCRKRKGRTPRARASGAWSGRGGAAGTGAGR